jgi:hypothetical protein
MSSLVNISFATEADAPALAKIGIAALQSDLVRRVIFPSQGDAARAERDLSVTLGKQLRNPKAGVIKATLKDTDKIVAYVYFYLDDTADESQPGQSNTDHGPTESFTPHLAQQRINNIIGRRKHWGE